jgi:hypothetical protein
MLRTKLEAKIDSLLGSKLQESAFLAAALYTYWNQLQLASKQASADPSVITAKLADLRVKRQRVLDTFFEGVIEKQERDRKLAAVQAEVESYQRLLVELAQSGRSSPVDDLEKVLEPFMEWEFLEREDKRALLALICPEIRVFQYSVKSLVLRLGTLAARDGNEVSRSKMGA